MDASIIVALIALAGVIISAVFTYIGIRASNKSAEAKFTNALATQFEKYSAVTDTKLENLTREVRQHNNFAVEIPAIKVQIENIKADIKELKCS